MFGWMSGTSCGPFDRRAVRLSCLASSSVRRSDRARCQPPCSMTRTISAIRLRQARGGRILLSSGARRSADWFPVYSRAWPRQRSPASSCARAARSVRGFPEPYGPRCGRCRSRCQAHGWCRHSGPGRAGHRSRRSNRRTTGPTAGSLLLALWHDLPGTTLGSVRATIWVGGRYAAEFGRMLSPASTITLAWLASPRVYGDARLCHDGGDPPSCQSAAAKKNATPNHGQNKTNAASSLIRWSIQEVRRIAIRLARKRIQPAHIIAWSL
jgi:hypothetical protein